jgi:hypothetical protein
MMNYKMLAAASVSLMMLTSQASAQCAACAMYPNIDSLNGGETPAAKMGLEHAGGAASTQGGSNAYMAPQSQTVQPSPRKRGSTRRHPASK